MINNHFKCRNHDSDKSDSDGDIVQTGVLVFIFLDFLLRAVVLIIFMCLTAHYECK